MIWVRKIILKNIDEWHEWYAWYPVIDYLYISKTETRETIYWLETIERKRWHGWDCSGWYYRKKGEDGDE